MILELKYAEDGKLDAACRKALKQIDENRYEVRINGRKTNVSTNEKM